MCVVNQYYNDILPHLVWYKFALNYPSRFLSDFLMDKDRKLTILQIGQFKEAFDIYDPKNVGLVPTM